VRSSLPPLLLLLWACSASAAEVTPIIEIDQIGIAVAGVKLPGSIEKDLKSGLTNKLWIRAIAADDRRIVAQRGVEIAVKYDLWDENYRMTLTVESATPEQRSFKTAAEVIGALTALKLPKLFSTDALGRSLITIKAELLLNPIERERIEKIRNWVTDNNAYLPAEVGGFDAAKSTQSKSNAVLNRIFEQYFDGADIVAVWKDSGTTQPFRVQ
jgi:hypothetical protein